MKILKYIYIIAIISTILSCGNKVKDSGLVNGQASLPTSFNFESLGLKAIASFINKKSGKMSTMYANEMGAQYVISDLKNHVPGEVIVLITWEQKNDDRWFGAKVPGELMMLEVVKTAILNNKITINYEKHLGEKLIKVPDSTQQQSRIKFILNQKPSVMP